MQFCIQHLKPSINIQHVAQNITVKSSLYKEACIHTNFCFTPVASGSFTVPPDCSHRKWNKFWKTRDEY